MLDLGNFMPGNRSLATAITSIMVACYFMGITVVQVADQELGLLMLWMLLVSVTMPVGG